MTEREPKILNLEPVAQGLNHPHVCKLCTDRNHDLLVAVLDILRPIEVPEATDGVPEILCERDAT